MPGTAGWTVAILLSKSSVSFSTLHSNLNKIGPSFPEQLANQAGNGSSLSSVSRTLRSLHLKSSDTGSQFQPKAAQKCAFDRRLRNFTIRGLEDNSRQSKIFFIASGGLMAHKILIRPPQRSHFKTSKLKRIILFSITIVLISGT